MITINTVNKALAPKGLKLIRWDGYFTLDIIDIDTLTLRTAEIAAGSVPYPDEHLEHCFAEIEVDRPLRLRICPLEIEDGLVAFPAHRACDFLWSHAHAIIPDVVFE